MTGWNFSVRFENKPCSALTGDVTVTDAAIRGLSVDEHNGLRPVRRSGSLRWHKLSTRGGGIRRKCGSSQFAICTCDRLLPGQSTVFGRVMKAWTRSPFAVPCDPTAKKGEDEIQLPPDAIIGSVKLFPPRQRSRRTVLRRPCQANYEPKRWKPEIRRKTSRKWPGVEVESFLNTAATSPRRSRFAAAGPQASRAPRRNSGIGRRRSSARIDRPSPVPRAR